MADGGAMTLSNYVGEAGVSPTESDGTAVISSTQLRDDITVKVVDEVTGQVLPNINVQWMAHQGMLKVVTSDPSGQWAPTMYQGDPTSPTTASVQSTGGAPYRVQPQVLLTGTLLLITVVSITLAELDYITDVYQMNRYHITNAASVSPGYGVFRSTVGELADYMSAYYSGKSATISLALNYITAGIPFPTDGWSAFGMVINESSSAIIGMLLNELASVSSASLYGDNITENTEIWVVIENWDSVGNDFLYDVDIKILPLSWDDQYEDNNSLAAAKTLRTTSENNLVVYQQNPDFYRYYLNPGDSLNVEVSFLNAKGNIDLNLYGPDQTLIDQSTGTGNTEAVGATNATAGWYYLEVSNTGGQWDGNMYNISSSSVGGEAITNRGDMRFVLTWGESPRDLDSHMVTPSIEGLSHHIYFGNQLDPEVSPFVGLDVDDTSGFGPETITVKEFFPGTYKYSVHNFSGSPDIVNSQAKVSIFDNLGLVEELDIPTTGSGLWWNVLEVDGSTRNLTIINQISNTSLN
ncbi:hypothetical protein DESUT3_34950 [Desulfuromonas versatilis]|uniref:Peptidase C-terminal archaeal/bacterial domain-containing protein n=2 Tax=Desulfuromonas versatilis TaxID=2802975 RepID=A0ABM8HZA1_9BACT|nr:hypothetical protein DESUT3_34950 [Desulfuromonas versatilis]